VDYLFFSVTLIILILNMTNCPNRKTPGEASEIYVTLL